MLKHDPLAPMLSYAELYGPDGIEEQPVYASVTDPPAHLGSSPQLKPRGATVADITRGLSRPDSPLVLPAAVELDGFLDSDEPDHDWLVEGLLERGDRVMVTGPEGSGKSTLLRQCAVMLAAGLHPFTTAPTSPLSVLLVDCENSRRQVRRKLRPLRDAAGERYEPGRLHLVVVGGAVAIAAPNVEDELAELVVSHDVDVLVVGPLYKLTTGDPVKEEPARALADALDRLRAIRGSALLIEAHSPYADGSRTKRPRRPYGASLWSRWPEFGFYLDPDNGDVDHWRGQRDERQWPSRLLRGEPWPWTPAARPTESTWDGPTECMAAILSYFTEHEPDAELTKNKVGERLRARGLRYREQTIRDALEQLAATGTLDARDGPNRSRLFRLPNPEGTLDDAF